MKKIDVGIIGAGYIGQVHASVLKRDERVNVSMVHDIDPARAERFAISFSCQIARGTDEVLENCAVVYITTPNTKHVDLAIAGATAGRHVFCEKPMATNVASARAVLNAAVKSSGVFQVGHNRRFAPVYANLKQLLSGTYKPHSAHVKMNRGELLKPEWVGNAQITGGFLFETTIHMFDMMRFLFGEVRLMYAFGSRHEYAEIDDFSVLLQFETGVHATFASSADASWLFPFERVEVFCHHATVATREMETLICSDSIDGHNSEQSTHQLPKEEKWGYAQEDRAFIDAIVNASSAPVTAFDGFKSVELVEACYEAVNSGKLMEFANVPLEETLLKRD